MSQLPIATSSNDKTQNLLEGRTCLLKLKNKITQRHTDAYASTHRHMHFIEQSIEPEIDFLHCHYLVNSYKFP